MSIERPVFGTPLVERFSILGLNGYKNISIEFDLNAKIVAAENGSGKTTLLNTLYALLTRKYHEIGKLDFDELRIKFAGTNEITLAKEEFSALDENFRSVLKKSGSVGGFLRYGLEIDDLVRAASNYMMMSPNEFMETPEFELHYRYNSLSPQDTYVRFAEFFDAHMEERERLLEVSSLIDSHLGDIDVMYLPTYRRVETNVSGFGWEDDDRKSFGASRVRARSRSHDKKQKSDWDSDQLLFFGLNDVERKLRSITGDIRRATAAAYSRISGRTLEQLLETGELDSHLSDDLVTEDLKVVLARLGKADAEARLFQLIDNDEISNPHNKYLRSFLGQMLEIYRETQEQELAIENFVSIVESYWEQNAEEKHLSYDKFSVEVKVKNIYTEQALSLNDLSSGEKQIISVFARLYLNPDSKYIILIDEPELSLSMDWQRKFLPDIFRSPSCAQLIAITHSPFIFQNELDVCAGALDVQFVHKNEERL